MNVPTGIFTVSQEWRAVHAGASAGVLLIGDVSNQGSQPALDIEKEKLEHSLRMKYAGYARRDLENLPILQAYAAYYDNFKKTYHLLLQLESIVQKGKSIPAISPLVQVMFMAEMKNLMLTAGHDLKNLFLPIRLETAHGDESYTVMRGQSQQLKTGDMYMADGNGVISSVLYGPDQRSQITENTTDVVYTVYAPAGVHEGSLLEHLQDIEKYVLIACPEAHVETLKVYR